MLLEYPVSRCIKGLGVDSSCPKQDWAFLEASLQSQFESASNDQHSTRSRSMECLPVPGQS